ncbi:hypothetical protein E1200_09285 [Actinomadura sp. GC306]|uniref:hypothetical protein n=1 Tax=Actinomadura sp. GC306 TaxID=2530367 RepID=UPI0010463A26|nr:hypothetical protein [Actinomadura sp. GC306]TDC69203.1 hypothetical protein E1200_09285 [Actinomadura sp. GC306]
MVRRNSTVPRGRKESNIGWLVGVLLLGVAAAGCSGESTQAEPVASESPTQSPQSSSAPQGSAGSQSSPEAVVRGWTTALVTNQLKQACMSMAVAPDKNSAPSPATSEACGSGGRAANMLRRLQPSFTPANSGTSPQVKVADVTPSGGTVTVSGDQITVDGQTLTAIVLSNSTGLKKENIGLGVKAGNISGKWYVTDIKLSIR